MFHRILRSPEGEAGGAAVAEAPNPSEGVPVEDRSQEVSQAQAAPEFDLDTLLKKAEKPGFQPTDEELDALEKHWAGELDPKKEKPDEPEGLPEEKEQQNQEPQVPVEIDAVLKEVGAKTPAELMAKVKELKSFIGSRDAQAFGKLDKEHKEILRATENERRLWDDVGRGVPEAIEYLEQQAQKARARYGVNPKQQAAPEKPLFIDTSKFAVPEEGEAINQALDKHFGEMRQTINEQKEIIRKLSESESKRNQEYLLTTQQSAQIDEMMDVASNIPELSKVPGLRDKITAWVKGTDDEALSVFNDIFQIANENKTNLRIAFKAWEADRLRAQIAKAKDQGVREAYSHKPNPTLADLQGRGGQQYTHYTDSQLKAMTQDHTKIPDEWFGKDGNLDKAKMPKRAVEMLLANEEDL